MKNLIILSLLFSVNSFASSSYDKVETKINRLVKKHSHLEVFNLGKNDQGKEIRGVLFKGSGTKNVKHLVVGTHHGNEVLSADLAVKFIEHLGKKGPSIFKDKDIYVLPVLNIGGYNIQNREEKDFRGRSHDPNRDYPDPCVNKKDFRLKSTSRLATFVRSTDIVGAITIHGYYGSLTYPWGIYSDNFRTLDHDLFEEKASKAVVHNSYEIGTHADVLYPAGGAFEDWAYYELGIWSLLVELENAPKFEDDVSMLVTSINSFPTARSSDHRHLGRCTRTKDYGISRP